MIMKLYKILKTHYSPKDGEDSIHYFLVANNDEEVFDYLDKKELYGKWTKRSNECGLLDIYDDNFNVIGQETYKQKMIRICGEFFDEHVDTSKGYYDSYYGVTHYGWEEEKNSTDLYQEVEVLKRFDMLRFASEEDYEKFIQGKKINSF